MKVTLIVLPMCLAYAAFGQPALTIQDQGPTLLVDISGADPAHQYLVEYSTNLAGWGVMTSFTGLTDFSFNVGTSYSLMLFRTEDIGPPAPLPAELYYDLARALPGNVPVFMLVSPPRRQACPAARLGAATSPIRRRPEWLPAAPD